MVEISARQTSREHYGIIFQPKAKSVVADSYAEMVSTVEFADIPYLCQIVYCLDLLYRCLDAHSNRPIADTFEISVKIVSVCDLQNSRATSQYIKYLFFGDKLRFCSFFDCIHHGNIFNNLQKLLQALGDLSHDLFSFIFIRQHLKVFSGGVLQV